MKTFVKLFACLMIFTFSQLSAQTGAVIQFDAEEFNFGKVNQGEIVRHTFKFKNTGDTDLTLTDVKTSCGCTASQWKKSATKSGESGEIEVSFNSAGKMGPQKKSITVTSNAGMKILYITGDVFTPTPNNGK